MSLKILMKIVVYTGNVLIVLAEYVMSPMIQSATVMYVIFCVQGMKCRTGTVLLQVTVNMSVIMIQVVLSVVTEF